MGTGLTYKKLSKKYQGFGFPVADVSIKGKHFVDNKDGFVINRLEVELCSGFEASAVECAIFGVYDEKKGCFKTKQLSSYVELGAEMSIQLGYGSVLTPVFTGFVAGMTYEYEEGGSPCVKVEAFDIKGLMMANHYSTQLKAAFYGDAVREILSKPSYAKLAGDLRVSDTPDKKRQEGKKSASVTVEMTAESDYEFVVKAARRYNYEFFTERGTVFFRKAKSQKEVLASVSLGKGIQSFEIDYSVTGIVESVEVRAVDAGTGKLLSSAGKRTGKISNGSMAARLLKKSKKVVIDPTASDPEELNARRDYLLEDMSYRFGTLICECVGIPDLLPGRFIRVVDMGETVSNEFYVTKVVHQIDEDGYRTRLTGAAAQLNEDPQETGGITTGGLV